ncbi:MAG: hypothetical protein IJZ89_06010 [Clostridia bacterium]|nr:hypothetical protein [Clostridia bacterium]
MSIKMRVLVASPKKKMLTLAYNIKNEFDLVPNAVDKIPPAYSCDKERIVILAIPAKQNAATEKFCKELNKTRAANVAILIDGTANDAAGIKEILKSAGTNVIDEVFCTKCGLPFLGGVKPEENASLIEWVNRVIKELK